MRVKLLLLSAGVILIGRYIYNLLYWVPPTPVIEDIIWKSGNNLTDNTIYPFRISIPQQVSSIYSYSCFMCIISTVHVKQIANFWFCRRIYSIIESQVTNLYHLKLNSILYGKERSYTDTTIGTGVENSL